ncbi:hypothetical protein AAC387_Pa04g0398 [Persea americana]
MRKCQGPLQTHINIEISTTTSKGTAFFNRTVSFSTGNAVIRRNSLRYAWGTGAQEFCRSNQVCRLFEIH